MVHRRASGQNSRSKSRHRSSRHAKQAPVECSRQWHTIDEHGRPQSGCVLLTDNETSSDWDSSAPLSVLPRSRGRKRPIQGSSRRAQRAVHDEASSVDDWVRNLVELRRWRQLPKTTTLTSATKEWLSEQHQALENATLPFLLKCVLTVCNASPTFQRFRKDFMRPEYRNRYWSWCLKYVELVDYYLDYGHVKVHLRGGQRYRALMLFIQNARAQKEEASLPSLQEQVLSAMGVQWERDEVELQAREDFPPELEPSNNHCFEPNYTEWDLEPAHPHSRKAKVNSISQNKKRRLGSASTTHDSTKTKPHSSGFDSGYSAGITGYENNRRSILNWAKHLVELRQYFRQGKGYEIPPYRTSLNIWMHAEMARSIAGTLPAICCCVLKVTKVTDAVDDTVYISEECESWCKSYVEYLDFNLEASTYSQTNHKPSSTVIDFMVDCRQNAIAGTLSEERSALLRAVDERWHDSNHTGVAFKRSQAGLAGELKHDGRRNSFGSVEEVELDSGTCDDILQNELQREPEMQRKRRPAHTAQKCKAMVSAMITGVVGEKVEGRRRTTAEKRAAEWVNETGPQALNKYAQLWFTDATMCRKSHS